MKKLLTLLLLFTLIIFPSCEKKNTGGDEEQKRPPRFDFASAFKYPESPKTDNELFDFVIGKWYEGKPGVQTPKTRITF